METEKTIVGISGNWAGPVSFGTALEFAKQGRVIRRSGWNGKNQWVSITPQTVVLADQLWSPANKAFAHALKGSIKVEAGFTLKTEQESIAHWAPSGSDCLAEDWEYSVEAS